LTFADKYDIMGASNKGKNKTKQAAKKLSKKIRIIQDSP
jgi:hypothetical protein|tara:strand:- start:298 stop:414 length:117 start_codon:yes stop_codon:yes gene_type:complete